MRGYDPVGDDAVVGGNAHVIDSDWSRISVHADDVHSRLTSVSVRDDRVFPRDPEFTMLGVVQHSWTLVTIGILYYRPSSAVFPALKIKKKINNDAIMSAVIVVAILQGKCALAV